MENLGFHVELVGDTQVIKWPNGGCSPASEVESKLWYSLQSALEREKVLEEKYNDLLYAVVSKFDGETRHETAKRYIVSRETRGYEVKAMREGK